MNHSAMGRGGAVNLIPRRVREARAVRRRVRRWLGFGAAYTTVVVGAMAVLRLTGGEEASRLSNDNGMLVDRLADAHQQLEGVRKQVQELSRRKEASETVGVHPDWSLLLAALAEMRGEDILLQSIDLRAAEPERGPVAVKKAEGEKPTAKAKPRHEEAYTVELKGYGLSQGDVVRFIRRLEDRGPLAEVRLKESRSQPHRGVGAVAFTAQFRLAEGVGTAAVNAPAQAGAEKNP